MMHDPTGYGRVIRDTLDHVAEIVEQKAANPQQLAIREANMGIYCYRADLFWKYVDEIRPDNPAHEYYLTDMVAILDRAGFYVEAMQISSADEALGINDRVDLAHVDRILRHRKSRELMIGGDHREAGDGFDRRGRAHRDGYRGGTVRAHFGPDFDRRELPDRRGSDRAGFRNRGRRRDWAVHHCEPLEARSRRTGGSVRASAIR